MNDVDTKHVADILQACLAHYCNDNGDWLALLHQQLGLHIRRAEERQFIDGRNAHVLLLNYLGSSYAAAILYDRPGDARLFELVRLPAYDAADDVLVAFAAQLCFWEFEDALEAPCTACRVNERLLTVRYADEEDRMCQYGAIVSYGVITAVAKIQAKALIWYPDAAEIIAILSMALKLRERHGTALPETIEELGGFLLEPPTPPVECADIWREWLAVRYAGRYFRIEIRQRREISGLRECSPPQR